MAIEIGVFLRPYYLEMLEQVKDDFEVCIFTASEQVYANCILDYIDPHYRLFKRRLYRNDCTVCNHGDRLHYIKDLRCILGFPASQITIVDNSIMSFALQPENGVPISSYTCDSSDYQLQCLMNYLLHKIAPASDVRDVHRVEFKIQSIIDLAI